MNFNISVKKFLEESRNGNINYSEFCEFFNKEVRKFKSHHFFRHVEQLEHKSTNPSLFGLPVSAKDCLCVKGMLSSGGSKILDGYVPPFDATVIKRIKENGGIVFGKTNQDEFGFGTFSTNSAYGIPKNPRDETRSCGGSSGGAAGITSALNVPHIALAESTGGSISAPASFCGVFGLTPTYGLVSRYGLIDYANSLDKIGPMGKRVFDVALALSIIAGYDAKDSTSLKTEKKDYTKLDLEPRKIKIGVPKEYFKNIDPDVKKLVWNAIKKLESAGATYEEVSLPNTKYALSSYYIIATSEASTNLARYGGMRFGLHDKLEGNFNEYFAKVRTKGFGEEAKRRIILGTFARMSGYRDAYYLKAMKVRTLIIEDFKKAFKNFDVLMAPTMPVLPPKFTEIEKLTPLENYQMDVLTVPANLAGIPMISTPCGDAKKLPVGLHILGDHLQEEKILKVANFFDGDKDV